MPPTPVNRELPLKEITKLLKEKDARAKDGHLQAAIKWPGEVNILRLAQAVSARNKYVIFTGNKKFEIRYESKYDAVFIKPFGGKEFAPCGYVSYKRLKEVLQEDGDS